MPEVTYPLDRAGLRVIDVLLIEDDPGDVLMTTEAFELSPVHSTLHVVSDGEQALRFLRRAGEFTGTPRPRLILLDLNLPRRNGLEVLAELKADPDLLKLFMVCRGGSSVIDQGGRQARLSAAEFAFYDTRRPYEISLGVGADRPSRNSRPCSRRSSCCSSSRALGITRPRTTSRRQR